MALPLLYKHGYTEEIWTTKPTASQLSLYFSNWKRYVASKGDLPYDETHISAMRFRFLEDEIKARDWLELEKGLQIQ